MFRTATFVSMTFYILLHAHIHIIMSYIWRYRQSEREVTTQYFLLIWPFVSECRWRCHEKNRSADRLTSNVWNHPAAANLHFVLISILVERNKPSQKSYGPSRRAPSQFCITQGWFDNNWKMFELNADASDVWMCVCLFAYSYSALV